MTWILYGIWFFSVSLIPLVATMVIFFACKKHLKWVPALCTGFAFLLVVRDVLRYMPSGAFIYELVSYFRAEISISFYVFYLPMAFLGLVYPVLFYLIGRLVELITGVKN